MRSWSQPTESTFRLDCSCDWRWWVSAHLRRKKNLDDASPSERFWNLRCRGTHAGVPKSFPKVYSQPKKRSPVKAWACGPELCRNEMVSARCRQSPLWNCHRHIMAIPPAVPTLQIWDPPADCRNLDRPSGPAFYLSDPCTPFPAS
jgi:hypothetical protein